jgi:murein L,D-transpeptidase YcbB/YkuD
MFHPLFSYRERTLDAVKAFQKKKGLTSDSVIGPKTLNALRSNAKTQMSALDIANSVINAPTYDITQSVRSYNSCEWGFM